MNRHNLGEIDREIWIDGYTRQIVSAKRCRASGKRGEEGEWGRKKGRVEGQEEINRFWKELKDTSPIQWFKELAHSQRGGAGATAGQKNMKCVQMCHTPPSSSKIGTSELSKQFLWRWSNSDEAVYRFCNTALTNYTYSTWWLHFSKAETIM